MSVHELNVASERLAPRTSEWHRAARRARLLSWFSLAWMGAEGAIAVTAGILAGSIALIGFGIDSAIEGLASVVIVWRFTGTRLLSETAEGRAQKLVAVQFFLLAPYVGGEAIHKLISGTARRRLATPSTGMTIRLEAATRLDRDSRLPRELARRRVLLIELMTC